MKARSFGIFGSDLAGELTNLFVQPYCWNLFNFSMFILVSKKNAKVLHLVVIFVKWPQ